MRLLPAKSAVGGFGSASSSRVTCSAVAVSCAPMRTSASSGSMPASASASQNPRQRSRAVKIVMSSPTIAMRRCPSPSEVLDAGLRAADVVEQHRVGLDAFRRPVDEDDLHAQLELGQEIAVVVPARHDQQPVDAALAELQRQLALAHRDPRPSCR